MVSYSLYQMCFLILRRLNSKVRQGSYFIDCLDYCQKAHTRTVKVALKFTLLALSSLDRGKTAHSLPLT